MCACGTPVAAVYVDHAPGNIRLSECAQCGYAADEYVECEMMVLHCTSMCRCARDQSEGRALGANACCRAPL
ncbi:hypothetical protein M758_11G047400 [Ceratodon purpureus]|nr:hypothetical protein M758_11G047400 [Ceratodon purpureus]